MDSFSTDQTLDIINKFPQARVVQRAFDTFADQCNFGLEHIRTDWVLSLDADYVLSDKLIEELRGLTPLSASLSAMASATADGGEGQPALQSLGDVGGPALRNLVDGGGLPSKASAAEGEVAPSLRAPRSTLPAPPTAFQVRFRYCIAGHPLRASLYPPRTVLYRKTSACYKNDGHGHRVQITGPVETLNGWIDHDDRKPLDRWLHEQNRYACIEAEHLLNTPSTQLNFADRLRRKIILAPFLVFFYTLFGKGLILDGWPGWYYVFQRTIAEMLLSLRLIEQKLKR